MGLKTRLKNQNLEEDAFVSNKCTKLTYYTGLTQHMAVVLILNEINDFLTRIEVRKLTNFQKLLFVLIKLRLNLDFTDLGYRSDIRSGTASSIFKRIYYYHFP